MPRRAFSVLFQKQAKAGPPSRDGCVLFILGGPADRLHRPRRPGRAPRKQKGLAGSWARKAHARLALLCQGCTLPSSVQLQKRRRHACDWVQGVGRRDIWAVTRVQAGKQERELLLLHAGSEGSCSSCVLTCLSGWRHLMLLVYYCMYLLCCRAVTGLSQGSGWDSRRAASEHQSSSMTVAPR